MLGPFTTEHGDHLIAETHRNRLDSRRQRTIRGGRLGLDDRPTFERPIQHTDLGVGRFVADIVVDIDGLTGGRADLGEDSPLAVGARCVEQQIGKAQVGEQTPFADEQLQMPNLLTIQRGVRPDQIAKRAHRQPPKPIRRAVSPEPNST